MSRLMFHRPYLKKIKTKTLFTPWKFGPIKKFKFKFGDYINTFDWYLFQLIILLKPDINSGKSFTLSSVEKVTIGT